MNIIYSKNTHNRKKEYQITTQIIKYKDQLFVYKFGAYHCKLMINYYHKLKNNFASVPCYEYKDGVIFPYINGYSLEDMMNEGRVYEALKIYKKFVDVKVFDFVICDEFIKWFGTIDYNGKAFLISNIDMVFSNIIISSKGPIMIDYEWVADFLVPKDFIIYRALKIYYEHNPNCCISIEDCFKYLNIEVLDFFDLMMNNFNSKIEAFNYLDHCKNEFYIFEAISDHRKEINRLNEHISSLGDWGKRSEEAIEIYKIKLTSLDNDLKVKHNNLEQLKMENMDLSKKIADKDKLLSNKDNVIDILNIKLGILNEKKVNYKEEIKLKTEELKLTSSELTKIKESTSYRYLVKYYKFRDFLFPYHSKRRLIIKIIVSFIKHPIKFMKKINFSNIKKYIKYSKKEGNIRALERLRDYQSDISYSNFNLELFDMKKHKFDVLEIPKYSLPLVSIIIPVYNQFSYTYGCIEAIIKNTKEIEYEIIIGDDSSNDETINIKKYIKNIRVCKNKGEKGFVENCNSASKVAKGMYLVFLNNDTNVQWNWLKSLIDIIESHPKAGLVGSKLVYPNGLCQEAGGILWQDGSAWNYGNKKDPNLSEFNYVKAVDYISGASILIKKSFFDEIGGFDKRYIPAYCEDSDLAFEVRKRGYEVLYDPHSVVVHYEGISNGKEVSTGLKKYQIDNTKKFYHKWQKVLKKHFVNGLDVFLARDRSITKKSILVIDHYVPEFDKDAGSRTVFSYLKLLSEMGLNVKFIGENFYKSEPYTTILQRLGIEVLYGPYYANNWEKWLIENGKYFDYVFLNRPHITIKFLSSVKSFCHNAKLIYYGHDLHYIRCLREYELKKDTSHLKESNEQKKVEFSIFKEVDLIYYPSVVEVLELKKEDEKLNVKVLQPYLFSLDNSHEYKAENREDILFIGGFRHSPNLDGIIWFLDSVFSNGYNIKLHIAGSHPPTELLKKASDNIIIHGFVSDDELKALYKRVRLVIVPLRYGAGIKGKVIEAMYNKIPVLTTECGAEGINCSGLRIDNQMNSLKNYYEDFELLNMNSQLEYEFIEKYYSESAAKKKLELDLEDLRRN